jgi:hypothetical protein
VEDPVEETLDGLHQGSPLFLPLPDGNGSVCFTAIVGLAGYVGNGPNLAGFT